MQSTKTLLIAALAVAAMLAGSPASRAQDSTNTPPAGQRPPGAMRGPNLDRLGKMLDLTDTQKTQIKPILEDQATQIKALRADTSLSKDDRRAKMKALRETFIAQMKTILTPDQFVKFENMARHRGVPPGGSGAPPPQN